jgi:hypothetical protein
MRYFYGFLYPREDFKANVRRGTNFQAIGTAFPTADEAEDQLLDEQPDVVARDLPVGAFIVQTDEYGVVVDAYELELPRRDSRRDNPVFGGMAPFFFSDGTQANFGMMQMPQAADSVIDTETAPPAPKQPTTRKRPTKTLEQRKADRAEREAEEARKKAEKAAAAAKRKRTQEAKKKAEREAAKAAAEAKKKEAAAKKAAAEAKKKEAAEPPKAPEKTEFTDSEIVGFISKVKDVIDDAREGKVTSRSGKVMSPRDAAASASATGIPVAALDPILEAMNLSPSEIEKAAKEGKANLDKRRAIASAVLGDQPKAPTAPSEPKAPRAPRAPRKTAAQKKAEKERKKREAAKAREEEKTAKAKEKVAQSKNAAEQLAKDIILSQVAIEIARKSKPMSNAAGAPFTVLSARATDTASFNQEKLNEQVADGASALGVSDTRLFQRALSSLKSENLIAVRGRKNSPKKSYRFGDAPPDTLAAFVFDAVENVADFKKSALGGARLRAQKMVEGKLPASFDSSMNLGKLVESMRRTYDAKQDCGAYWEEEAKKIAGMEDAYVQDVAESIADVLTDRVFLNDVTTWLKSRKGGGTAADASNVFYASIGTRMPAPGMPYRLISGISESDSLEQRQDYIAPYLLSRGFYYTKDDPSGRYCVANPTPLKTTVWDPVLNSAKADIILEPDEVLGYLSSDSAASQAQAEEAKKSRRRTQSKTQRKKEEREEPKTPTARTISLRRPRALSAVNLAALNELVDETDIEDLSKMIARDEVEVSDILFGEGEDYSEKMMITIFDAKPDLFKGEVNIGGDVFDGDDATPTDVLAMAIRAISYNQHPTLSLNPKSLSAGGRSRTKPKAKVTAPPPAPPAEEPEQQTLSGLMTGIDLSDAEIDDDDLGLGFL